MPVNKPPQATKPVQPTRPSAKPVQPNLTLVSCDDWEALYVNGKCVAQNHTVQLIYELKKLGLIDIAEVEAYNDPYPEDHGRFPDDIRDVTPDHDEDLPFVRPVRGEG